MKKLFAGILLSSLLVPGLLVAQTAFSATSSIGGRRIVIDPGHGGGDFGSTACPNYPEKEANLDVANKLAALLLADGAEVYPTRTNDSYRSNADRYNYANSVGGEVLVSIHLNGSANPMTNGTLGLYGKRNKDRAFTEVVHQQLAQGPHALKVPDLGVTNFASGVLLKSRMPATIQETVFISNETECDLLTDGTGQRQGEIAQALYDGLVTWFDQQDEGNGGGGPGKKCETPPCGKNK